MLPSRFVCLAAALCAALLACSAHAAGPCAAMKSIVASSVSDAANRAAGGKKSQGGHVGLHMRDARSPLPKSGAKSQLGKSAFADWDAFTTAFGTWRTAAGKHVECGSNGSQKDIVDAASVGITEGWTCAKAGKDGICTQWDPFEPVKVCFWYANAQSTGGTWLLNTAYPSRNEDCS
jgi:hypothetical protein